MTCTQDKSVTIAEPSSEPLTLSEAKNQVEIAEADLSRDSELSQSIVSARELVEGDTNRIMIQRTITESLSQWPEYDYWCSRWSPLASCTSIKYYNSANTLTTVSTSDYSIDVPNNRIVFDWDYAFPVVYDRWDAIVFTVVCGYGTTPASVPAVLKQMMRLQIAYAFDERNMKGNEIITGWQRAYNALLNRVMRSTYP